MYVSESDYHYFAQIGTTKRYLAGEYIFTRGELASTVYLIKSGRVLVTTSLGDGRMLTFSVLKKGSIFGDGAFADHYLREVDISAVTDVEVIVCETKDLPPSSRAASSLKRPLRSRTVIPSSPSLMPRRARIATPRSTRAQPPLRSARL